jgi:hypothetical protein
MKVYGVCVFQLCSIIAKTESLLGSKNLTQTRIQSFYSKQSLFAFVAIYLPDTALANL